MNPVILEPDVWLPDGTLRAEFAGWEQLSNEAWEKFLDWEVKELQKHKPRAARWDAPNCKRH